MSAETSKEYCLAFHVVGDVIAGAGGPTEIDSDPGFADTTKFVGAVASSARFLFAPREPAAAGVANVRMAVFPLESRIVPPERFSELVETYSRSVA